MKILLFSPYFYPHQGGTESFNYELSKRLISYGHDVHIVSSRLGSEPYYETIDGIKVVRFDSKEFLGLSFPYPVLTKKNYQNFAGLFHENFSVGVTSTRFFVLSILASFFLKKNKIPQVHIEHCWGSPKHFNPILQVLIWIYDFSLSRIPYLCATEITAVSNAVAHFIRVLGARDVKVIPNSIDYNHFHTIKKSSFASPIKVLFVGRLIKAKGVQNLIKAFIDFEQKDIRLDIVGYGPYETTLRKIAGQDKRIRFLGPKTKKQLKKIYAEADIFVNPSFSEGLPTCVLEAGAAGLAIVATDVGGTNEIITHGKNGFLYNPKKIDDLKKYLSLLINNPKAAQKVGLAAQKIVCLQYDWNRNARKMNKLIKSCAHIAK